MSTSRTFRWLRLTALAVLALSAIRSGCSIQRRSYNFTIRVYVFSEGNEHLTNQPVKLRAYRVDQAGNPTPEDELPAMTQVSDANGVCEYHFGYRLPIDITSDLPTEDVKLHVSSTYKGKEYDKYVLVGAGEHPDVELNFGFACY